MRATIRACASAAGVHAPSRSGTMPSATQRRSVAGETERERATSVSVSSAAIALQLSVKRRDKMSRRVCGQCGPLPWPVAPVVSDAFMTRAYFPVPSRV